ncbi:scuwaprin-a-like [Eublepharis macularius]|uniref:Scuwaprin-a-like n=1 Tax=Eublepharis macularius TaxID=481883 RepID=A0AA97L0K9_EUBMA|nr:scuwaprin-a-like [Eublepharis macularius]
MKPGAHLLLLAGLLALWALMPPASAKGKPGSCPVRKGPGICLHGCSSDYSCPGRQKCCSNGCGHVCMDPVFRNKPGRCPRHKGPVICGHGCSSDFDCGGRQKCCGTGCGRMCKNPVFAD